MTEDKKYNGWTNYATWRVNLELCDDILASMIGEQTFEDVHALADALKNDVENWVDDQISEDAVVISGWVSAFLSDVDWLEIARANADELVETDNNDE